MIKIWMSKNSKLFKKKIKNNHNIDLSMQANDL